MFLSSPSLTRVAAFLTLPLVAAVLYPAPAWSQEVDSAAASLAITPVTVIDVRDGEALPDRTVVVEGERITAAGPTESVEIPSGARVVDGTGKYLIPGLWDMHAHATSEGRVETFFPLLVANGVTGIRDPWGSLVVADNARAAVERAELVGPPRIVAAGNLVDGPPGNWPGSQIARSPADGRRIVDSLHTTSVPFVKVYHSLPAPTYFAIANRTSELGLPFVGHVPFTVRAAEASEAGQRSIEHLFGVLTGCSSNEEAILADAGSIRSLFISGDLASVIDHFVEQSRRALATQDDERCRHLAERFIANETWQVPTLVSLRGKAYVREMAAAGDPRTRYFKPPGRWIGDGPWPGVSLTEEQWKVFQAQYEREKEIIGMMAEAGVPLLSGSDTATPWAFPGFGLHDELELLVEAGLTPLQALQAATLNPARFFEATDSLGTVEAGKLADLVLLDANPLGDIDNTREIAAVVLDGRYLDRTALDGLLEKVEQANQADAADAPPVVTITATDQGFRAPDTIAAGLTRLRFVNKGEYTHMAHAIRLDSGKTAQELLDAYAEAIRTAGPRPTWITRFGGTTAEPNSESTATQYLEPGNYVWVCPIEDAKGVPHFSQGFAQPFVVRPADGDAAPRAERPEATIVIRMLDYSFDTNPPLTPGPHVIRVENVGGDSHDVALLKLATGRTMEDFQAWMQNPQGPPPASLAGSVAPIAPGHEAFFEAELTTGQYLLVCFSTAPDGRTHIEHGMIQQVRVG